MDLRSRVWFRTNRLRLRRFPLKTGSVMLVPTSSHIFRLGRRRLSRRYAKIVPHGPLQYWEGFDGFDTQWLTPSLRERWIHKDDGWKQKHSWLVCTDSDATRFFRSWASQRCSWKAFYHASSAWLLWRHSKSSTRWKLRACEEDLWPNTQLHLLWNVSVDSISARQ